MRLKTIVVDIYGCLREVCMTAGAKTKLQVDGVISVRSDSKLILLLLSILFQKPSVQPTLPSSRIFREKKISLPG